MSLSDEDGRPVQVGQSVGRWLSLEDFVCSDGSTLREDDLRCLGFPRNWPAVYSSSEALKALIGKRGRLPGSRVAVAGQPLPEEKVDGLALRPLQSFGNAERAARASPGLSVVRGWAVFERLDKAEGSVFVAERYWWNSRTSDGRWVDLTPRPEAIGQLLLAESSAGGASCSSQKPQAVLGAQEASLASKLLSWRYPSLVAAERRLAEQAAQVKIQQKDQKEQQQSRQAQGASSASNQRRTHGKEATQQAQQNTGSSRAVASSSAPKSTKVLDYSKWSNIVDSDDEDEVPGAAALDEDVGVQDLAELNRKKPLPVPDFLVGNTGGGGGTNCYLSVTKLLDAEADKGESERSHQLSQVFGKIFHTGLVDAKRQDFYKKCLAALPADTFVVVLGLGSVLPVIRAARRGEKTGALLETSTKLAEVAEHILKANKLGGFPVTVLKGGFDHADLQAVVKRLVPKNAKNVAIVTERMAHDLLSNGIVPSCVAAHKAVRAALPGAKILHVPRTVELFVTPVEIRSEKLKDFDIRPFNAFRHTTSNDKADFWWWPVRLDNQPNTNCKLLGPSKVLCGFDFERSPEIALEEVRRSLKLEVTARGRCNGVALWWTAKSGSEEYSSRPNMAVGGEAKTAANTPPCRSEWKQAIHYLAGETSLFPGDTLELLSSITPRFTVRMLQQSPFSVEAPQWIQAPNNPKFSATLPVLPYHFLMLQDLERIEVYQRAIRAAAKTLRSKLGRRPRVLDAGCGLGLLGMTAALEGCEVWLCEAVPIMRKMCRDVVAANTQAITEARGLVQLLPPMMSTRIQIGEDVQNKFDMVVAEVMDLWCLGEGIVPTMRHAHKKLLAEGGMMLPSKLMIFVQPMELNMWNQAERETETDLQALGKHLKSKFSPMRIDQFPVRWLTEEPIAALEVDLGNVPEQPKDGEPNMEGGVKLCIRMGGKPALHAKISTASIDHSGTFSGYGIWWAADLGHGNVVSNAPDNPQRSWKQIVRWLDQPRFVAAGEEIQVLTCYNDHQVNVEDIFVSREMAEQYQEQVSSQQAQASQAAAAASAAAGQARPGRRPEATQQRQQQTKQQQPPASFEEEPALEVD
eukprot:TRINITY_DN44536_c0_g1_i1.p1 TRINITY_DN44536_c0_g1~~TRINITY_DN44536_c0_g1_i1.p1  ORF type:complete len:1100 (-),score=272.11 TRINITY_DN44536_c0_g1_i1:41-3298(-)